MSYYINGFLIKDTIILAIYYVIAWTLAGLVTAWRIKPEQADAAHSMSVLCFDMIDSQFKSGITTASTQIGNSATLHCQPAIQS